MIEIDPGATRHATESAVFGRQAEQAQLERLLDQGASHPSGLLLEGSPGIGKSTLTRAAVASARHRGYRVIATAPGEPDAGLGFAGLGDLFDRLPESILNGLPDPQRRALSAALFVAEAAEAPSDPQALPRAVLSVLRQLAADAPVLVAIDDEQWLDRASARVLGFAVSRLRDERVCVLVARRSQSGGAFWPEIARGFGTGELPSIVLEPLDMSAVHRLLAAQLDRTISRPLLRRVYSVSGGNPLYALAIAREVREAGGDDQLHQLPIPSTLADALANRLARLDTRAADPLLVTAAVSNPPLALVQSVLPDFVLSDLDGAQRERIIELTDSRVRFTHPLLAAMHYAQVPAARRRSLHRLLAEVLVADEEERAHHLALGAEAPDHQIAVALEQAAGQAARRGAPEAGAELLEQACRLTPADAIEALRSRRVAAAEMHFVSGDSVRARSVLEALLAELPSGPIRARALLQLAKLRTDDFEASTALAEQALAQAAGHDRVGAQIEALLGELWSNRGDQAVAGEHGRGAVGLAERSGDPGLLAQALAFAGINAFFHGDGVQGDLMRRAIALEHHAADTPSYYLPSTALGNQLLWSDALDAARPLLEGCLQRSIDRGEESDRHGLLFHLAHLEWEAGNHDRAQSLTEDLIEATRQQVDEQADSYLFWLLAFVAARRGSLQEARARATQAAEVAARIGDAFILAFSTAILAAVELWSGQPDKAHERLPPLRQALVADGRGFVGSLTLVLWTYDIEALITSGRLDDAEAVLNELLGRVSAADNPNATAIAHRSHGLLLAARGKLADAIEAVDSALAEHARRPLPFEVGRTLLEKGTLERRAKRKSAAKQSLELALVTLEPLAAALLVTRARDELGRIGLRRATVADGLTPTQIRVAELVVSGMTNREIATTLYMSLRTVETHLTKIYRELGVRSRSQLAGAMAASASRTAAGSGAGPPPA